MNANERILMTHYIALVRYMRWHLIRFFLFTLCNKFKMYIKIECECVVKKPRTQIECKLTRIHLSCSRTDVCTGTHTSNDLIDFPFMKPLSDSNEKKERRTEQTISIQFDSQT